MPFIANAFFCKRRSLQYSKEFYKTLCVHKDFFQKSLLYSNKTGVLQDLYFQILTLSYLLFVILIFLSSAETKSLRSQRFHLCRFPEGFLCSINSISYERKGSFDDELPISAEYIIAIYELKRGAARLFWRYLLAIRYEI